MQVIYCLKVYKFYIVIYFVLSLEENNILRLLEGLVGNHNLTHDSQKDLLTWVLKVSNYVILGNEKQIKLL